MNVALVFYYDVFWRACDWYTNRAHNLNVRTNACACAHAQAYADSRIIKDCYICFPYVRAAASAARASVRTSVRTFARTTVSGTGSTAYPCPNPREFSIVCKVWTLRVQTHESMQILYEYLAAETQMNDGCVYGGTLRDAKREPLATRSGFFCN